MKEKHIYCVKCQSKKTIIQQSPVMLKNGAIAVKGHCPQCAHSAYKIIGKEAFEKRFVVDRSRALHWLLFGLGVGVGLLLSYLLFLM